MVKKLICVVAVIGLALAGSVASGEINGGLVGYWPLDGNASDVSGNGLDGEIVGDVVSAEDRLGYEESAMLFPGDQRVGADPLAGGRMPPLAHQDISFKPHAGASECG